MPLHSSKYTVPPLNLLLVGRVARRFISLSVFALLLSACQSVSQRQTEELSDKTLINQDLHFESLKAIESWKIAGKLGVITPEKRTSVYINWAQNKDESDIKMTNILGVQLARVRDNKNGAELESDGKVISDSSAEGLIYQITGWFLPVSQLKYWIKALPTQNDQFDSFESGLVSSINADCINCDVWEISYDNYKQINGQWLPHKVRLSNDTLETRLNFTISKWMF
jgi:outer membrane lipoprotein LolB